MLIRLALIALFAAPTASQDTLEARAAALRADLASNDAQPLTPRISVERQLLTSLERRIDIDRARTDTASEVADRDAAQKTAAAQPTGLLEADDLRRLAQELDLAIDAGSRRLALARVDRAVAAATLVRAASHLREIEDSGAAADSDAVVLARLEAELAESTTAELDGIAGVVEIQQQSERSEREAIAKRLATVTSRLKPTADEVAEIERRLARRSAELGQRLADAAKSRESAHADVEREAASASPARLKALRERLTTRDIEIELIREAMSNLGLEQAAWQLAIRYWRDGDLGALADARERGPAVRDSLARRLDFMSASFEQFAAQSGTLGTRLTESPESADAPDWQGLRDALDERMRLIERGMLDQRRVIALMDRLSDDFDVRINSANFATRVSYAGASLRRAASDLWNYELFVVDQTVDVGGRETKVPRSITVEKIVKAPLLLLISLLIAYQLTRYLERRSIHRGTEPANARLARRWTFGVLACASALASLAIAGIPFAAFAFIGGAVAIGIGFGMQTLFKNLISGVLVLIERPFRLGDEIQIGDLRGTVVDIDLRASVLRDSDGAETLIPNSALVEQNVTARPRAIRQTIAVTVDAQSDPRSVSDTMREAAERHGLLNQSRKPEIFLDEFPGEGLRFSMCYWIEPSP
ncbi:MAG TPA: mechanosensitive ion channel domain-containing protein, partial [Rhodanobacteraceae bacterium]|nr:mechanosensitive ion channel domain-containing protein [Rhodanobacteraceae bacterium]